MGKKRFGFSLLLIFLLTACIQTRVVENSSEFQNKLILITLDGLRWQEVFRGLDKSLVEERGSKQFESYGIEEGRKQLMPFLWGRVEAEGIIRGNRDIGDDLAVQNPYRFSYPGYSELLTGIVDPSVNSNNKISNPNVTILERANNDSRYTGKVAAFSSWDVFPYIINEERSGIPINAGHEKVIGPHAGVEEDLLNALSLELPYHEGVRSDALTFNYAFQYLKKRRPDVLYISFDETDHYAHSGRYRNYTDAIHRLDSMIERLWDWVEADPYFRNSTTLVLTTDHGRGEGKEWTEHRANIEGSEQVWYAVIGSANKANLPDQTIGIANWIAGYLNLE